MSKIQEVRILKAKGNNLAPINPATEETLAILLTAIQANILSAYASAGQDTSGEPMYVGGVKSDGSWYIKAIYIGTPFTTKYVKGASDFGTAWTARAIVV